MFPALVAISLVFLLTLPVRSVIDVAWPSKVFEFASAVALACSAVVFAVFAVVVAFSAAALACSAVVFAVFAVDVAVAAAVFASPAAVLAAVAVDVAVSAADLASLAVLSAAAALTVASLILPRIESASVSDPIIAVFKASKSI